MTIKTTEWFFLYIVFISMAVTSLTLGSLNIERLKGLACLDCPNGRPGQNGTPGFCEYCCPDWYTNPLSGAFMLWTHGNVIAPTINAGQGWAFTNEREFSTGGQIDYALPNATIANFPFGVWQFTYEISLQIGTTVVLQENSTSGGNVTDLNSITGSTLLQTWISGLSIENITDTYKGFLVTTTSTNARAVRPGPAGGLPLIRFTAIQYVS